MEPAVLEQPAVELTPSERQLLGHDQIPEALALLRAAYPEARLIQVHTQEPA